ncbi:TPA: MFS transporter permease [Vibrio parahaemolyticus]|nr:MFS transporter permease [Vibrio parahaemolyticus]
MIEKIPSWAVLKSVEDVRLVKSTYVWLVVVPIAVKLLSKLGDTVTITVAGQPLTFDLVLPFSWQLFYLSALSFVLGNVVFLCFAPSIAKEFRNYGDFRSQGKLRHDISNYKATDQAKTDKRVKQLVNAAQFSHKRTFTEEESTNKSHNATQQEKSEFWAVFNERIAINKSARAVCSFFYLIGFVLFLGVMTQNIIWTLNEMAQLWQFL